VKEYSEVFVGMDVSKSRIAVGLADGGGGGEARFLGEVEASEASVTKLIRRLSSQHGKLTFCYEAGPTGYGLYRLIGELGHERRVVAPSLIPRRPGDRVKTNRRDALSLARLLRAGELTAVWAPDERHEAMRDLVRARSAAFDLRVKRQQTGAFLLRLGRVYPGKKTWGGGRRKWLAGQAFAHLEPRIAFEELATAMDEAKARVARLEKAIEEAVPDWSLAPMVTALMAMRAIDLVAATTILAEVGDLGRFRTPARTDGLAGPRAVRGLDRRQSEALRHHQGRQRSGAQNPDRERVVLSLSRAHRPGQARTSRSGADSGAARIAWKAQTRLAARYRALMRKGKLKTVAVTAVARELAGFIWAIHRALATEPAVA
jgi:transposase